MGLFKNISNSFIKHKLKKHVEKSSMTAEQKKVFLEQGSLASDLISTDFENGAKSGVKSVVAFIDGFLKGGPVKAFENGIKVSAAEAEKNQQKFIASALEHNLPITVNGQLINPQMLVQEELDAQATAQQSAILANAKAIGLGALAFIAVTALVLSVPGDDDGKNRDRTK